MAPGHELVRIDLAAIEVARLERLLTFATILTLVNRVVTSASPGLLVPPVNIGLQGSVR